MSSEDLGKELRELKVQSRADLQLVCTGLQDVSVSARDLGRRMNELADRIDAVTGRLQQNDDRFQSVLETLEALGDEAVTRAEFDALERRVSELERRASAA